MLILIFIASICPCWAQQPGTKVEGNPTIAVKECSSRGCSFKDHKLVLDANWRWIHNEEFQSPGFASMILDGKPLVNLPRLGNLLELCVSFFFGTQVDTSKELLHWKSMGHFYLSGSRHLCRELHGGRGRCWAVQDHLWRDSSSRQRGWQILTDSQLDKIDSWSAVSMLAVTILYISVACTRRA